MKKSLLLLSILFLPLFSVFAQEQPFYYYHGRKIALKASTSEVYVKYREGVSASRKLDALKGMRQLTLAKDQSPLLRALRYELTPSERSEDGMKRTLAALRARPDVEAAFPAYITEFGDTLYVTNEVIYMPKVKGDPRLQGMHNDNNATVIETFSMGPDKEQVLVKLADGVDPLVAAQRMVESGLVEFAQPNFMTICHVHQSAERATPSGAPASDPDEERARQILKAVREAKNPLRAALPIGPIRLYLTPNDPSFVNQWFLQNTGQNIGNQIGVIDADISATEAWDITTGSASVVVSVWDSGYDLAHPELAGQIVGSYDAAGPDGSTGFGGPAVPTNPGAANENHGTPCAGLIAALTNNNASVASVGYNVRVFLVRNGFNYTSGGSFSTTDAVIARCATATLAVSGVVAVSQSWGGGSANASWEASFNSVRTGARGGLGAVMLFSAGNAGTGIVGYPARAANIIAVGATDNSDRKAGFSQFGDSLDVVAPGVNTLTLDRQGAAGYEPGNETFFGGTSAACPVAAGVVALAASANSSLTGGQLEEILQRTCDKVGNYAYGTATGRPLGLWTNQMGYGRVNARRAVQAAQGNATLTLTNPISGSTWQKGQAVNITWVVSSGTITTNIVIELYKGSTLISTLSPGAPNTGTFSYTPPLALTDGNDYRIRLTANSGTVVETSPFFTIATLGGVFVYSPSSTFNTTTTYTDLGTNGSVITTANFDDANSAPVNIGFNFDYNGRIYSQFILNTNGFIKLGNTPPSSATLFISAPQNQTGAGGALASTNPADVDIISIFNHDLQAGTSTPEYRVHTTGTAPNRVCTIQFKNVREKQTPPGIQFNNMNFQIRLHENGMIEFVYGTFTPNTSATDAFRTFGVGIKGLSPASAQLVTFSKGSTTAWSAVNAGSSLSTFNVRRTVGPDAGRTFRFVPIRPAVKLAILNPLAPTVGKKFAVVAEAQDAFNLPQPTTGGTLTLSLVSGTGTLTGNLTATLNPGQSRVVFRNLQYSVAQPGVQVSVSGLSLTPGTATFTVSPVPPELLYESGPLVSNPAEGTNFADASVITEGLGAFGFQHSVASGLRVAMPITVPPGQGWRIDSLVFFAYQTGSTTTSTIDNVNLRIWRGTPGAPGSEIIFGNTTTNRLNQTRFSGIYRVTSSTLTDVQRPIMAQRVLPSTSATLVLGPGTYWLDWQTGGTLPSGPWVPPITIEGQLSTGNARQFNGTTWVDLLDNGFPQGLPFQVYGQVIPGVPFTTVTQTAPAPVGNPSTIDFPDLNFTFIADITTAGTLTVNYYLGPPVPSTPPTGIVRVSSYYWDVTNVGTVFTNGRVRSNLARLLGVVNPSTLRWLRRPNNTQPWSNLGGTVISGNLQSTNFFNAFSEFSIGSETLDNPLPVELTSFTGSASARGVQLQWQTASELNNAGFVIMRSAVSADGETTSPASTIASYEFSNELRGKGTTATATTYSFLDNTVEAGQTYLYRLRSVDFDGTIHDYPTTVRVEVREPVQARVYEYALEQNYPNPFNPSTTIPFTMKAAGPATLIITDILGRTVLSETIQARAGENQYRFVANNLGSGLYFYTLRAPGFQQTKKMMLIK
jgi:hypothetical protein